MKVYVCIPSLNEAQTIGHVTSIVDQGLQNFCTQYADKFGGVIVNVDSNSTDGTSGDGYKTLNFELGYGHIS